MPNPCGCGRVRLAQKFERGRDCARCWRYAHDKDYRYRHDHPGVSHVAPGRPVVVVSPKTSVKVDGPGTELTLLLAELGLHTGATCSCKAVAAQMNKLGVAAVRKNAEVFAAHLRGQATKVKKWKRVKTGIRLAARGFNPLSPFGGLVEEACRRAEVKSQSIVSTSA